MAGVPQNAGADRQAVTLCRRARGQQKRRRAIRDRRGIGGGHRAILAEGGLQQRDLFGARLAGLFIRADGGLTLAVADRHRRDFTGERARGLCGQCIRQRPQRVSVLIGAGELKRFGAIFGECAHQAAFVIGVLQPVEEHVSDRLRMAQPGPRPHLGQKVGGVGHAFHPARDHDAGLPQGDLVKRHHRRLHARAAHLVQRGRGNPFVKARVKSGLPRGGLTQPGGQNATHQQFFDQSRRSATQRRCDRRTAKPRGVSLGKDTLKPAHRRARRTRDHHIHRFVLHHLTLAYRMVRIGV
ncbi:hypothetical protein GALL_378660 [mine drainage metagenome]|uniref:Uncharacterized protein n=1 Tax=mine drainage metagenome TaxID=410659 RepID=A0A1J5QWV8_9ZZZZ